MEDQTLKYFLSLKGRDLIKAMEESDDPDVKRMLEIAHECERVISWLEEQPPKE